MNEQVAFRKRISATELQAMKFVGRVERALSKMGIDTILDAKPETLVRLLNLRGAILKHRLPLSEILTILLSKYRRGKGASSERLGVSIKVLTGTTALQYLDSQVKKKFPNSEQIKSWRLRKQQSINSASFQVRLPDNPEEFPERYLAALTEQRENTSREADRRLLRRYRNSPWT